MNWWNWLQEHWGAIYGIGALLVGVLSWLGAFVGIWWFAAYKYALGGLVLGWLPGMIAACLAALVLGLGWPLFAAIAILVGSAYAR